MKKKINKPYTRQSERERTLSTPSGVLTKGNKTDFLKMGTVSHDPKSVHWPMHCFPHPWHIHEFWFSGKRVLGINGNPTKIRGYELICQDIKVPPFSKIISKHITRRGRYEPIPNRKKLKCLQNGVQHTRVITQVIFLQIFARYNWRWPVMMIMDLWEWQLW